MTKEEIKDLITAKIAGQGNQVDIGGALATILNEIVDGMGGELKYFEVKSLPVFDDAAEQTMIDEMGLSFADLDDILNGKYIGISNDGYKLPLTSAYRGDESEFFVTFGSMGSDEAGQMWELWTNEPGDIWSNFHEI